MVLDCNGVNCLPRVKCPPDALLWSKQSPHGVICPLALVIALVIAIALALALALSLTHSPSSSRRDNLRTPEQSVWEPAYMGGHLFVIGTVLTPPTWKVLSLIQFSGSNGDFAPGMPFCITAFHL